MTAVLLDGIHDNIVNYAYIELKEHLQIQLDVLDSVTVQKVTTNINLSRFLALVFINS